MLKLPNELFPDNYDDVNKLSKEKVLDDFNHLILEFKKFGDSLNEDFDKKDDYNGCTHGVLFDEDAAKNMSVSEVQKAFPRGWGPCPLGCGFSGIAYASYSHYIYGDW